MGIVATKTVTSTLRVVAADLSLPAGESPLLRIHCSEDVGGTSVPRSDYAKISFTDLPAHPATRLLVNLRAEDVPLAIEQFLYALLPGQDSAKAAAAVVLEAESREAK